MLSNLSRACISALMPPGAIWEPIDGFDNLLDGVSLNTEVVRAVLAQLAYIRDPLRTSLLSDLEKEYGVIHEQGATEQERRERLLAAVTKRDSDGTAEFMEEALQAAGFDVLVHINNPPQDPGLLAVTDFITVTGNAESTTGTVGAFTGHTFTSGSIDGELVVNCGVVYHPPTLSCVSGNTFATTGSSPSKTGALHIGPAELVEYEIPADPGYWGLFFFVGGVATRDPVTGIITNIEPADVPISRREELKRLILKYKPMYSWCVLVVNWV